MSIGALSSGGSSAISSQLLKYLDKDSSGAASLDEFKSVGKTLPSGKIDQSEEALNKAFSSLDADANGSLTESEIAQGLSKFSSESAGALLGQQEVAGGFNKADADGSGTVSLDELTNVVPSSLSSDDVESLFSSIDTDGDGEITGTEDEAFRSSQSDRGGPGGPRGAGGPPPELLLSEETSDSSTETDDSATTLPSSLSDLLGARSAYSQSTSSSYLSDAIESLFSAAA